MNIVALKSEAVSYRFTHDDTDIQSTFKRIDLIYTYHGRESGNVDIYRIPHQQTKLTRTLGTFAADEHLAGLNPSRGYDSFLSNTLFLFTCFRTETCDIVYDCHFDYFDVY